MTRARAHPVAPFPPCARDQPPSLIVIIDKKTKELQEACDSIPIHEKKVMEFKIYKRKDSGLRARAPSVLKII